MSITLNCDYLKGFVESKDLEKISSKIKKAHKALEEKTGPGKEFLGWVDLPGRIENKFINELVGLGTEVRQNSDALVSIGIGGSYLGIRATTEFFGAAKIPIHYAGHNISSDHMHDLLETIKNKNVTVVVISKSGSTTEPAVAFRVIKKIMLEKYQANEFKKRIICVTDLKRGALRKIADQNGFRSFVIPDDVGGRFSIFTPVGLVPLAIAGIDIKGLVEGARTGQKEYAVEGLEKNIAYQYAGARSLLYGKGKVIEVLSAFYPNLFYVMEWWKQLFGESEGKDGKGIFPASVVFTSDLHSMGQLLQDGMRNIFETFLMIDQPRHEVIIPKEEGDLDGFNCVAGKGLDFVNKQAYYATTAAHYEGKVPNMTITLSKADAFHLGQLYYLFERAVGISGYLLGVNPFDQPGVEAYKKKMYKLLGKK